MPVTVNERVTSRQYTDGEDPALTTEWFIDGTDDEIIASQNLKNSTPLQYPGASAQMLRRSIVVTPIGDPEDTLRWFGTVEYGSGGGGSSRPPEAGEKFFNFDTGANTDRRFQSINTVSSTAAPGKGDAPDYEGNINATKDGTEGVDVYASDFRFSETHYFGPEDITDAYIKTLTELNGRTNTGAFRGYAIGEVLFLNASGSRRGTDDDDGWEISFNFAVKLTIPSGLKIGSITMPAAIKGWDYIWVTYKEKVDDNSKWMVNVPLAAYVEQIYETASFARLNIGTDAWYTGVV